MNILIIKIGAMGDVLRSTFIAQALKDKYRKSNPKIIWMTSKSALNLLKNNPFVDRIVFPEDKNQLFGTKFHTVINLEEDEENCRFASSLEKSKLIGFYYSDGKVLPTPSVKEWFDMSALGKKPDNDILKLKNKKTHRQILGEIVEIDWRKYEPFLRLVSNQRKILDDFLRRHNLSRSDLIIGINTGSADRWPKALSVEKTAKLIDVLYKRYNAKILLFGGPNEIQRNKEILGRTNAPVIDTGCGNDLLEFPALVSVCNILVTTDSLGLHISLALKRKTICLIGPTSNSEIDMYSLGYKLTPKSSCLCCYKKDCKSMEKFNVNDIMRSIDNIIKQKITLLITAFKEPQIGKAIDSALNQKTKYPYEIIVSAPDEATLSIARSYARKHSNISIIRDLGKGKSLALNMIFKKINTDILILTDGDVSISSNSIDEIANLFLNPEIGCVTGRPVPIESKKLKYGYWANFLFEAAHKMRKNSFNNNSFLECSGYLFAFRKNKVEKIPLDVAEDTIIPYYFWEKGYGIGYAEKAEVYVKNVDNWKDWINQKIRTSKAHETLHKYADTITTPRAKTLGNESRGIKWAIEYPKSFKEYLWTGELILARLYMWIRVIFETRLLNKNYGDAWDRVESTK